MNWTPAARALLCGSLFGLGLATAGFAQGFEHPPGFALDPAVPVAGRPFEVLVDLSVTGASYWCYLTADGGPDLLPYTVEGQTLVLFLRDAVPPILPIPCPNGDGGEPVRFAIPGDLLAAGYHDIEVRYRYDVLPPPGQVPARSGVDIAPDVSALTLWDGRFRLVVAFTDPTTGGERPAHAVPLSSESGLFWFFSGDNVEVTVKLLDGRPVNGHWWFFIASQTSLPFEVVLTHHTPECTLADPPLPCPQRTYTFAGGVAVSRQDILAFPE